MSYQSLSIFAIADDTKINAMGRGEDIDRVRGTATGELIRCLEDDVKMKVSRNKKSFSKVKMVAMVPSRRLGIMVKAEMSALGIILCKKTNNLGGNFAIGSGNVGKCTQTVRRLKGWRPMVATSYGEVCGRSITPGWR